RLFHPNRQRRHASISAKARVTWAFKAPGFKRESIVRPDGAVFLDEKQFIVGLVERQIADPSPIQGEAVQRSHFQDGKFAGVVILLNPVGELTVEGRQGTQVQGTGQGLLAHGSEKSFNLTFGGSITNGSVMEKAANPRADLDDLLGSVNGAIIHVEGLWDAAF